MNIPKASLENKKAIITGSASGIGKACTKLLAYAGAQVALIDHNPDNLRVVRTETSHTQKTLAFIADVGDTASMSATFDQLKSLWEHADILIVNAGINGVWSPLETLAPEEWDRTMNVNLRGTYLTVKFALPLLKARGGSIIIVSSVNGTRMFSNTGATAYACTKAAQVAFTKMIALEFARHKIRVNVICPGAIETHIDDSTVLKDIEDLRLPVEFPLGDVPLTPGEKGTAGQVAQLAWFLASDASSHITGSEIFIDGAQSLIQG